MSLRTELSNENVLNYADACIDLALDIPEKNLDTLIIPSRGAVPIFLGMIEALNCFAQEDSRHKKFLDNLRIGKLVKKYLPQTIGKSIDDYFLERPHEVVDVLFLPLTADLNMEKYSKDANSDFYADNMRKFWPKVISALSKGQKERRKDPFLNFISYMHKNVEDRPDLGDELLASKWIEKKNFGIIDTVISGRAYSTILQGFNELKVGKPTSFLIIDDNGKRLKEKYSKILNIRKPMNGKKQKEFPENINAYYVNKIFSEDKGSALEGLVGVVYPSLMVQAEKDSELKGILGGSIACGGWYSIPDGFPHKKAFDYFTGMLKYAVLARCKNGNLEKMEENKENFLKVIDENDLLSYDNNKLDYIKYKNYISTRVYETGSHVLHVCFSDANSRHILNKFKTLYYQLK